MTDARPNFFHFCLFDRECRAERMHCSVLRIGRWGRTFKHPGYRKWRDSLNWEASRVKQCPLCRGTGFQVTDISRPEWQMTGLMRAACPNGCAPPYLVNGTTA